MTPKLLSTKLVRFDSVDSTNKKARELAKTGKGEGTVVIAKTQTEGRGTGSRTWHSPEGGIYLSTLLRAKSPHSPTSLSILAGAATAQTVRELMPKSVDVSVKWPNDCLIGSKKVSGILSEAIEDGLHPLCIVGIGINVNIPAEKLVEFENNPFPATSFQVETNQGGHDIAQITNVLIQKLTTLYQLYWDEGFESILNVWESNCLFLGKQLILQVPRSKNDPQPKDNSPKKIVGTCLGIDQNGALVLSNDKGERLSFVVGEILCFLE